MLKDLIEKNRSYRRFYETEKISKELLYELIDLARISSSAANLQSLKYYLSNEEDKNKVIFNALGWAGYLKDWSGPEEGEKPSAYIVFINDSNISKGNTVDVGIAATNILLAAVEKGFGGCMLANINKKVLSFELNLKENHEIVLVVALGKPKEEVVIETIDKSGSIKYWRDESKVHHVPKRALNELIIE